MARKHHRLKVHFGTARRGAICGLPWPRFGAGITEERGRVTCQTCLAALVATREPESADVHAARQHGIAVREHRRAVGARDVRAARRPGNVEADAALPVRRVRSGRDGGPAGLRGVVP